MRDLGERTSVPVLVCLASFVVTFLVTRVITRMIRGGRGPFRDRVTSSGVHVHHAVPGLVLLLAGAVTALASSTPLFRGAAAVAVGAGASLVLDEFALILHLEDVYWSGEGRASVQAVCLMAVCLALAALGFVPLTGADLTDAGTGGRVALGVVSVVAAAAVTADKGKYRLVLLAIFVWPLAFVGAVRLARPDSRWARRRYRPGSAKELRARRRAQRFDRVWGRRWVRFADLVAGAPDEPRPVEPAASSRAGGR